MNPNKNGKRKITFNNSSTFHHLFNQNSLDNQHQCVNKNEYQIERIHKKNISAFKSSIDSVIKYNYGQGHLYHNHDYATKPNNVSYNKLSKQ